MTLTATFSKLGRGSAVPEPLVLEKDAYYLPEAEEATGLGKSHVNWDAVFEQVSLYCHPHIMSSEFDLSIAKHPYTGIITGVILVGIVRPVGFFTVEVDDA